LYILIFMFLGDGKTTLNKIVARLVKVR
jgi:hypothetical protein